MFRFTFFLMLFLLSNSQIVDTAEGNLTAWQFIGVDIDSGTTYSCRKNQGCRP